jgi:TetR/AcrR family transcriptional regulator, cholesterol catabolism regulator
VADTTRDKILNSARGLFGTRGMRGTTVDDIARRAGVSKRTVYETFTSKDEIAGAIVDQALALFEENMRRIIQGSDDPLEKLMRLSRFYAEPQLSSKALIDLQRDLPELWERVEKVETGILQEMQQVTDEGKGQGVFDTELSTDIIIGALTGALRTTMAPEFLLNSNHSIEDVSSSLFELITLGICGNSTRRRARSACARAQGQGSSSGGGD